MVGLPKLKGFYFSTAGDFLNEKIFSTLNLAWIYTDR